MPEAADLELMLLVVFTQEAIKRVVAGLEAAERAVIAEQERLALLGPASVA